MVCLGWTLDWNANRGMYAHTLHGKSRAQVAGWTMMHLPH